MATALAEPRSPTDVCDFDRRVYRAVAAYAFDEAECWPSQHLIALDLGCARESVNRATRRLAEAGWLAIKERRMGWRGWLHNVYELLETYTVSPLAAKRITKRAHRRQRQAKRRLRAPFGGLDHTNRELGASGWCSCPSCRPDRASIGGHPPPLAVPCAAFEDDDHEEHDLGRW